VMNNPHSKLSYPVIPPTGPPPPTPLSPASHSSSPPSASTHKSQINTEMKHLSETQARCSCQFQKQNLDLPQSSSLMSLKRAASRTNRALQKGCDSWQGLFVRRCTITTICISLLPLLPPSVQQAWHLTNYLFLIFEFDGQ
jgi:hypothetical protein